jgi:Aspartic acid proteinase inhibitor
VRVVKVKRQVVAGTIHQLTIEAADAWKNKKLLQAKVWEKPWENFISLGEINHLHDSSRN